MNLTEIKPQLLELTGSFLGVKLRPEDDGDGYSLLQAIVSDSMQAITYVTLIESEFDIEFDDDEIDLDFFLSFDEIAKLIAKHFRQKCE